MRTLSRLVLVPAAALGAVLLTAAPAVAAPSDQDVTWMQSAHQSNLTEIAAGNAAQQSATTEEVRELGAMFVQMHSELDAELVQAAEEFGVELPQAPSAEQQRQLAAVQQNSGQAFDTAWISQQIGAHTTSLAATQRQLQAGSDPVALQLARTAEPVIEQHLVQLREVAAQYGVPTSVPGGTGGQVAGTGTQTAGWVLAGVGGAALLAGTAGLVRRRSTSA